MTGDTPLFSLAILISLIATSVFFISWKKHRGDSPLTTTDKIIIAMTMLMGISAALSIGAVAFQFLPYLSSIKIPSFIIGTLLLVLAFSFVVLMIAYFRRRSFVEHMNGIMAFLFFPEQTPEAAKTLEYHQKYLNKRLIVNLKKDPSLAFNLSASILPMAGRLFVNILIYGDPKRIPIIQTSI